MREIINTQDSCAYYINTDSHADHHRVDSVLEIQDVYDGEPIQIPSFDMISTSQPENEPVKDSPAPVDSSDPLSDLAAAAEIRRIINETRLSVIAKLDNSFQIPKETSPDNSDDIT